MRMQSRSYNPGPVFRPKPHILERPGISLMVISTSWNSVNEAEAISNSLLQQIEQSGEDLTTLFDRGGSSSGVDHLRTSVHATASTIFKQTNSKQARILMETLVLQKQGSSLIWAQVGQPNLYLLRKGRLAALAVQSDHSVIDAGLAPLPMVGLGLEAQTQIQTGQIVLQDGDQLLLLAQSWQPNWPAWEKSVDFRKLTADLIDNQPDLALWCGLIDF